MRRHFRWIPSLTLFHLLACTPVPVEIASSPSRPVVLQSPIPTQLRESASAVPSQVSSVMPPAPESASPMPLPSPSISVRPSPIPSASPTSSPTQTPSPVSQAYGSGSSGSSSATNDQSTLPSSEPSSSSQSSPEPQASELPSPSAPVPTITAQLRATRLTGPAPLAVMFDATGTSSSQDINPFHQLTYAFSFGDPTSANWAISGQPKNSQVGGPLAAHIFETPGTYTVSLEVRDASGQSVSTQVEINVENPDLHWAASQTICVSPGSDFTGCPAGATQQAVLPSVYENRRVLLHRGEAFGAIQIPLASDNLLVGPYGTGPKPQVPRVRIGFGRPTSSDFVDEITIMELDITGDQDGIHHQGSGSRFLLLRNDLTRNVANANNNITLGGAIGYYATDNDPGRVVPSADFYWPREMFIVENNLVGSTENDSLPHLNMVCLGSEYAFMGNDASRADEHTVRTFAMHKSFFAHNALRGHFNDARHALKFHAIGLGTYGDSFSNAAWASRYSVISHNLFGDASSNGDWTVTLTPQNQTSAEGIEDIIVENNQFVRGPATRRDIQMAGRRITVRQNRSLNANGILTQVGPIIAYGAPATDTYYAALPAEWKGPYFIQE